VDITKAITHLSLCSGYEGIGIGLRKVMPNVRECAHVEIEAFNIANLVAKMEEGKIHPAPVYTNLKTFPYEKFRGCVDILSGGFPCQPFSHAGLKKSTEDPRHLFPYIAEGIKQCRPTIVFLENVAGIISAKTADGESVLQYVLRTLEGLGYRTTAGIFSASEVGAPHQRKRVFILGYAKNNSLNDRVCEFREAESGRQGGNCEVGLSGNAELDHGCGRDRWPARPEEEQHEWEEPRVVADAKHTERGRGRRLPTRNERGKGTPGNAGGSISSRGKTKPQLGGAIDGLTGGVDATANRLDRLRACGNGVVPETVAKAFVTLINRLI